MPKTEAAEVLKVYEELKSQNFNEDTIQSIALALMEREDITDPRAYAYSVLGFDRLVKSGPDRFTDKETGRQQRGRRNQPPAEAWQDQPVYPSPEEILLRREAFLAKERDEPERMKSKVMGTFRKAECHPTRIHHAHGLCKACYAAWKREG